MTEEDLRAAVALKENYIRIEKGRDNRIGHNWEAAVEWFVDKFTTGASFREQPHRSTGMDSRRITLHLIRSVGGRRMNVEVDRVWTVTPGLFSPPTTYVLECKWGVVRKQDLDEFLNVLRWSTDFGVDTPDGRQLKQGVTGHLCSICLQPERKSPRQRPNDEPSILRWAPKHEPPESCGLGSATMVMATDGWRKQPSRL